MKTIKISLTLLVILILGSTLLAADLPDAAKLLDKYVKVTGGKATYEKFNTRKTTAKLVIDGAGITLNLTIFSARPNQMYSIAESPAIGKIESGVIDGIVWENSAMTGPSIKEGQEKANGLRDGRFAGLEDWREIVTEAKTTALDTVNDKPCYVVELKYKEATPQTYYFDKESGLIVQVKSQFVSEMGTIPVTTRMSDYREVDGIKMPFTTQISVMGQTRSLTLENVENNVEFPDSQFELPEAIKTLMNQE